MSRIEHIGNATLYLGDCREILPTLLADFAVVSDPPYGINHKTERTGGLNLGKGERRNEKRVHGDDRPFDPAPFLRRETILWGANYYADKLPTSGGWLVWDKRRGGSHAPGFIASDCEMAWTNLAERVRIFSHLWAGVCRDSEIGKHYHPTQKPIALMRWCIEQIKAATICDPFMGSGSTGVAAAALGRGFIGIEIDQTYFETACRRIETEVSQCRLAV